MKISVVIPVYNAEKYLDKLFDSILSQSYTNYEIICVNDGSKDNSYSILQKYSKNNNNILIFDKKNEGPGLTRKFGYKQASGDLIFFIDSDDYLPNNSVFEKIIKTFSNNNIDLLLFESERVPSNGINNKTIYKKDFKTGLYKINELNDCIVEGSLWMKIFKKNLFSESFFYNSDNFEDVYTTYKYLNKCENFYYLAESCYVVNRTNDNNSLTKNINLNKFISTIDIIIEINDFSKLQNSAKLMALNYYLFSIRTCLKSKEKTGVKIKLLKKLKLLKRVFKKDVRKICKENFRRGTLFFYRLVSIFI